MTPTLTPDALIYDLPQASDPRVSPDGRAVIYTLTTIDRATATVNTNVWQCDIDGDNPRQLTRTGTRNSGARWSLDGQSIAFVSDRVAKSGLFVLPADGGGEAREVTRHAQTIDQLAWSPDGARIAYVTQIDPEHPEDNDDKPGAAPRVRVTRRLDYKRDGRGYLGEARQQVFVVDVASGERRQVTQAAFDHAWPQWSPDGRWLAAQRATAIDTSQLALFPLDGGEVRLIGEETGVVELWSWSPDGDRLLLAADPAATVQTDLYLYDLATGALARLGDELPCLPHAAYPGPQLSQPVWLDERHALINALTAGRSGLYVVNIDTGRLEQTSAWQARHVGLSVDTAGRMVVQGQTSLTTVGEIVVTDRDTGTTGLITDYSAALLGATGITYERFSVHRSPHDIDAWLLLPPDFDPIRRYPLLLDIHGGPHNLYGEHFLPLAHCLASHGFLVVYANPRGSGSYGRPFAQAVMRDWGGEDYLDLLAVVDALVSRPYVDAARLGIYGFSYGGYMTAWAIGQTDRFAAAVCGAPVFDLESFFGTSDVGVSFGTQEFGVAPHLAPEWYAAHSPSTFAHRARTPTLIVHGEADDRCPIGQGEQMYVALARAGCEVEFVRYPGAAHGFTGGGPPEHRADYLSRTLAWFQHHLAKSTSG